MKRHLLILTFSLLWLIPNCNSDKINESKVQVFRIGAANEGSDSNLISYSGGHAIRIDYGKATLRIFRITSGVKTQIFEQHLDSSQHPMAWIAPRVSGNDVFIEFGLYESSSNSGVYKSILFKSPHQVGSNLNRGSLTVTSEQQQLMHYWILNQEAKTINSYFKDSETEMIQASRDTPVEYLLFTVSR